MTQQGKLTDEWGLLPILEKHNASAALPAIEEKFNAFCTEYLDNHAGIEKAVYTKLFCFLSMALIDSEQGKCDLRERIQEITDSLNVTTDET